MAAALGQRGPESQLGENQGGGSYAGGCPRQRDRPPDPRRPNVNEGRSSHAEEQVRLQLGGTLDFTAAACVGTAEASPRLPFPILPESARRSSGPATIRTDASTCGVCRCGGRIAPTCLQLDPSPGRHPPPHRGDSWLPTHEAGELIWHFEHPLKGSWLGDPSG
jgi:hypothetical protein